MKCCKRCPLENISPMTSRCRSLSGPSFWLCSSSIYPLRMARGVLRSWAAEAKAFVVLRNRSRNCSRSRATSSAEQESESKAAAFDGMPSCGLVPVGTAAGLLSDIVAMDDPSTHVSIGEGILLPSERGGYADTNVRYQDCQLEMTRNRH